MGDTLAVTGVPRDRSKIFARVSFAANALSLCALSALRSRLQTVGDAKSASLNGG